MKRIHKYWIEVEEKEHKVTHDWRNGFFDFSYREISKAIKNYTGRIDDYAVIYHIIDNNTLALLWGDKWSIISIDNLREYL